MSHLSKIQSPLHLQLFPRTQTTKNVQKLLNEGNFLLRAVLNGFQSKPHTALWSAEPELWPHLLHVTVTATAFQFRCLSVPTSAIFNLYTGTSVKGYDWGKGWHFCSKNPISTFSTMNQNYNIHFICKHFSYIHLSGKCWLCRQTCSQPSSAKRPTSAPGTQSPSPPSPFPQTLLPGPQPSLLPS